MENFINPALVLREQQYNSNSHLDSNNFYNIKGGTPETLSNVMVHLFGKERFPLAYQGLRGLYKEESAPIKKIKGTEYSFPIIGKTHRPSAVAQTPTGSDWGLGSRSFKLTMTDGMLKKGQVVQNSYGSQCYILDREKSNTGWVYTMRLHAASPSQSLDLEDVQSGTRWVAVNSPVPEERNRGTESNSVDFGKVKNQISYLKKRMSWGGIQNLNRVMPFKLTQTDVKGNTKTSDSWIDNFMYQFEMDWMAEKEHTYWYSKYSKDGNGVDTTFDPENGEPIPTGAGLLEQIPNFATYSKLTFNHLQRFISDIYYGQADQMNKVVTIYTGLGGLREADRALRAEGLKTVSDFSQVADKFIGGEGYNMHLKGYFNSFYHIDGYYVAFKHNPFFDFGRVADAAPKHPETGFSLESHRMVFIDTSSYDGQPNIQLVENQDYPYQHAVNLGMTDAPASLSAMMNGSVTSPNPPSRTNELNEGEYYRSCSAGIQLMRPNSSFNLECVLG